MKLLNYKICRNFLGILTLLTASLCGEILTAQLNEIKNSCSESSVSGNVIFTTPPNWTSIDKKNLSEYVISLVSGPSKGEFPPSINLAYDPFKGSIKDYLKIVNRYNTAQGATSKNLGKISTEAGEAVLLQVDTLTKWGLERQMQALLIHDGKVWILTTSALKDEFQTHYKTFFTALKSLRINP